MRLSKRQCPALSRRTLEKSGLLLLGLSDLLQGILAAEVRAALLIEAHELDPRHVADVQNVLDLFDAAVFELGDVDHAVVARSDLDERADRQDADDLAVVQGADLGDEADVVDHLLGGVARSGIDGGNKDIAFVIDVDLGAGVGTDLLDGLAVSLERRADRKSSRVRKSELVGLCILVAIPLPGTGAWTGALVAALMEMRLKRALPAIYAGVLIAGLLVTLALTGVKALRFLA